ncbi:MAG: hypothetical protein M3N31_04930 [Actinomycetota bacterium]|nr:hypothetical protein [Actinomycetota bacterium]
MSEPEPEQVTQNEVREEAAGQAEDPVTSREALETELMEQDESGVGEEIGDSTP